MFSKLKKAVPAIVSALLCVTMILGTAVSAADSDVWKEAKALSSLKYNSNYIKWAEKYSEKDTENTVTYKKSQTKKFVDKAVKTITNEGSEYSLGFIDNEELLYFSRKDGNFKSVFSNYARATYVNGNICTYLALDEKVKASAEVGKEHEDRLKNMMNEMSGTVGEILYFDIDGNTKGKIFKFKSGKKTYRYEEFKCENNYVDKAGFLFNEKGDPLAIVVDDEIYCISFKTKVNDSGFEIPEGYKTVGFDDFDY